MNTLIAEVVWLALGHDTVSEERARAPGLAIERIGTAGAKYIGTTKGLHSWPMYGCKGGGRLHGWLKRKTQRAKTLEIGQGGNCACG